MIHIEKEKKEERGSRKRTDREESTEIKERKRQDDIDKERV